jgi:hypothetical protein
MSGTFCPRRMDPVKERQRAAWAAHGPGIPPAQTGSMPRYDNCAAHRRGSMQDLLYIALTIVAFGVLWLLVKGVERFER